MTENLSIGQAKFLKEEERVWLHQRNADLKVKAVTSGAATHGWDSLRNYRTWHLAAISMVANIPKCKATFEFNDMSGMYCLMSFHTLVLCVDSLPLLCRWDNLLVPSNN